MSHPVPAGALSIVVGLSGCTSATSVPLPDAIVGKWEVWCRTDDERTTQCLGKEDAGMFKVFHKNGTLAAGSTGGTTMNGTWTLAGEHLRLEFEGGGVTLNEEYRARIDNDHLILWYPSGDFGSIHGRPGAVLKAAPRPVSPGGPTAGELGGLRYTITLPPGYRLIRDDNNRQRWGLNAGTGLEVRLTVSPRSQERVGDKWVPAACTPHDYGGVSGSRSTVDGVERDTSIGTSLCVEGTDLVMMCSAEHSRGYILEAEKEPGLALCRSVALER